MSETMSRNGSRDSGGSMWAAGASVFAACVMMMVGVLQVLQGLVALINGTDFLVSTPKYFLAFNATTWGWIHLVLGLALAGSGFLVFAGNILGRSVGITLASVSAVANFVWLPYYPIWGLVIIALDVYVIWGLVTSDLRKV